MIKQQFEITAGYKKWTNILLGVGGLALVLGIVFLAMSKDEVAQTRFWSVLLQNSVFFICATTLAMGGWQMAFRRVPEAISSVVPVFAVLALLVFVGIIFGHRHDIYHWLDTEHVKHDPILQGKSGFLNPTFFMVWTIITLLLWSFVGAKMRKLSSQADEPMDTETSKKFIWNNTVWGAIFIVFFALTVGLPFPGCG
jgi:cell division protein FtsW (lipid II flippase)